MSAVKAEDAMGPLQGQLGEPLAMFHEYDLNALGVPLECRPRVGQVHLGKHGYTLKSPSGAAFWIDIDSVYVYLLFPPPKYLHDSVGRKSKFITKRCNQSSFGIKPSHLQGLRGPPEDQGLYYQKGRQRCGF